MDKLPQGKQAMLKEQIKNQSSWSTGKPAQRGDDWVSRYNDQIYEKATLDGIGDPNTANRYCMTGAPKPNETGEDMDGPHHIVGLLEQAIYRKEFAVVNGPVKFDEGDDNAGEGSSTGLTRIQVSKGISREECQLQEAILASIKADKQGKMEVLIDEEASRIQEVIAASLQAVDHPASPTNALGSDLGGNDGHIDIGARTTARMTASNTSSHFSTLPGLLSAGPSSNPSMPAIFEFAADTHVPSNSIPPTESSSSPVMTAAAPDLSILPVLQSREPEPTLSTQARHAAIIIEVARRKALLAREAEIEAAAAAQANQAETKTEAVASKMTRQERRKMERKARREARRFGVGRV